MIRIFTCGLLLLTSFALSAQPLYRWIEADGSITFSPSPPTDGREFERVGSTSGSASGSIAPAATSNDRPTGSTPSRAQALAISEAGISPVSPQSQNNLTDAEIVARSAQKKSTPTKLQSNRLSYAPKTNNTRELAQGITPSNQHQAGTIAVTENTGSGKDGVVQSNHKFAQCQELRKRVVSLERQIKTGLTPERMDSTVVYMARYQRSINQHCG